MTNSCYSCELRALHTHTAIHSNQIKSNMYLEIRKGNLTILAEKKRKITANNRIKESFLISAYTFTHKREHKQVAGNIHKGVLKSLHIKSHCHCWRGGWAKYMFVT